MSEATVFQTAMNINLKSRSMGLKLMVVCALALVMTCLLYTSIRRFEAALRAYGWKPEQAFKRAGKGKNG